MTLAREWTRTDPVAALEWIRGIRDDLLHLNAAQGYIRSLSEKDPSFATQQALSFGDAQLRSVALRQIAAAFLENKDYGSVSSWLSTLPPGPDSDLSYETYVRALASIDPEKAISSVSHITEIGIRDRAVDESIRKMAGDLPEYAIGLAIKYPTDAHTATAASILVKWASYDYAGAEKFVKQNPDLTAENRAKLNTYLFKARPSK